MFHAFKSEDEPEKFAEMFGPGYADNAIRNAIQMVWVTLPREKKTMDELDKEVRRLMERALKDMREDEKKSI